MAISSKAAPENIEEVAINIASAAVSSWLGFYLTKRAVRKRGGPEWAQYGIATIVQAIRAPRLREEFYLSNEAMAPAIQKFTLEHIDEIAAFLQAHPKIAKYVKVG